MSATYSSSVAAPVRRRTSFLTDWFAEVQRRQPLLAGVALVFMLALIPVLIAQQIDPRLVNDINVWIKPAKFFVSLALHMLTLAWGISLLPQTTRSGWTVRVMALYMMVAACGEMIYIAGRAALGQASHINTGTPLSSLLYSLICVIINDDTVGILPLKIIAPITSFKDKFKDVPWMVTLNPNIENGLDKKSVIDLFQVRSVAEERLVERVGMIGVDDMFTVKAALKVVFGY